MVWTIALDYLLISFAQFALLPVLPVLLTRELGAGPGQLGPLLLIFALATRGGSMAVGPLIDRVPLRHAAVGGLATTALAFLLLGSSASMLAAIPCLAIAGTGISVHGVVSRSIVANTSRDSDDALRAYSLINVAVNIGAAAGPLVGAVVIGGRLRLMLWGVGLCYLLAALIVNRVLKAVDQAGAPHNGRRASVTLAGLFRQPDFRALSLTNLAGWFMYEQLFSALPLYLMKTSASHAAAAAAFTINGLFVAALQLPIAALTQGLVAARARGMRGEVWIMAAAIVVFGVAFLILGSAAGQLPFVYAAVAVFSLGETLFIPTSDAAFATLGRRRGHDTIRLFNARKITSSLGEALGALAGGSASLVVAGQLGLSAYWLMVGFLALAVGVSLMVRRNVPNIA
jgi:MFS transporter, DHA1 family, multidrug resistance protein